MFFIVTLRISNNYFSFVYGINTTYAWFVLCNTLLKKIVFFLFFTFIYIIAFIASGVVETDALSNILDGRFHWFFIFKTQQYVKYICLHDIITKFLRHNRFSLIKINIRRGCVFDGILNDSGIQELCDSVQIF